MQKYINSVANSLGQPQANVAVTVYLHGTQTLATIYSDNGVTQTANPVYSNSNGQFQFYAANARYDLSVSPPYNVQQNLTDILLQDLLSGGTGGTYVITGGSIDNTPIGSTTPASGNFSSLKINGTPIAGASPLPLGQCKLILNGSNLQLIPFKGDQIMIAGTQYTIPSTGPTLSNSGTVASTLYYIYAYYTGSAIALLASVTGHQTDVATGMECWTTDNSHTLVGMAYTTSGNVWQQTSQNWNVRSWFNDPGFGVNGWFTANRTSVSTVQPPTFEINTEIRCTWLQWTGENVNIALASVPSNATAGDNCTSMVSVDGSSSDMKAITVSATAAEAQNASLAGTGYGLAEGQHYATLLGSVNASTGTWLGSASVGSGRTSLYVSCGARA